MKLLADVGLVGLPSVGKSTILSMVSRSKPKIAAYHFTTLSPNLGVVKARDGRSFVMADLPGLMKELVKGQDLATVSYVTLNEPRSSLMSSIWVVSKDEMRTTIML